MPFSIFRSTCPNQVSRGPRQEDTEAVSLDSVGHSGLGGAASHDPSLLLSETSAD